MGPLSMKQTLRTSGKLGDSCVSHTWVPTLVGGGQSHYPPPYNAQISIGPSSSQALEGAMILTLPVYMHSYCNHGLAFVSWASGFA